MIEGIAKALNIEVDKLFSNFIKIAFPGKINMLTKSS